MIQGRHRGGPIQGRDRCHCQGRLLHTQLLVHVRLILATTEDLIHMADLIPMRNCGTSWDSQDGVINDDRARQESAGDR